MLGWKYLIIENCIAAGLSRPLVIKRQLLQKIVWSRLKIDRRPIIVIFMLM
jgi:hypothetical protein